MECIRDNIRHVVKLTENRKLNSRTHLMRLKSKDGPDMAPGQFVNVRIEGKFLRRPISVCDYEDGEITLLYDVVGEGTREMSEWESGKEVDILAPLGNGFGLDIDCRRPLLIGGGIGIAPLYLLSKNLLAKGKNPIIILGFNSAREVSFEKEFRDLGIETYISTVSGEVGTKGFVTDVEACRSEKGDYFYACGPTPMLKALCETLSIPGEVSLEARMACGFGVCVCCSLKTKNGAKRICKDGPVFRKEELIWE